MVSETSESRNVVSYLDVLIDILSSDLVCSILTEGMHLISILSIFLTYFGTFKQPQLIILLFYYFIILWHTHLTADKMQSGLP